ncbi:hypothetical protein FXO37_23732 [Capsicum annuum]|nr:hypothetical protein FXO37_23732 [Capsicum annuum]
MIIEWVLGRNLLKVSDDLLNMLRHLMFGHVLGLFLVLVLDLPTPVHPPALALQLRDRDDYGRRLGQMLELEQLRGNAFVGISTATGLVGKRKKKRVGRYHTMSYSRRHFWKKNLTDEDVWVEPRAKAAVDKYRQLLSEFHSSQPPENQGHPIPQHVEEELWEQTVGPALEAISTDITKFILARIERVQKKEEETSSQIRMLQEQFNSFIQTAGIIPPYLGDAVRTVKGLRPLDDINTEY